MSYTKLTVSVCFPSRNILLVIFIVLSNCLFILSAMKYLFATLSVYSAAKKYCFRHLFTVHREILSFSSFSMKYLSVISLGVCYCLCLLFALKYYCLASFFSLDICLRLFSALKWFAYNLSCTVTVVVSFPPYNTKSGTAFCLCLLSVPVFLPAFKY
jgi:hypothetical protein